MVHLTLRVATDQAPSTTSLQERAPWLDGSGAICARVFRGRGARWIDWPDFGLFAIPTTGFETRVWPVSNADNVSAFFRRRLQPLILQLYGYQSLHASAVLSSAGAVAFAGLSGMGKSTLACALRDLEFTQIADDAVVVDARSRPVEVRLLPFAPQLRGDADGLDALRDEHAPLVATAPLALIVVLNQDAAADRATFQRLEGPAACVALMAHAHVFDPSDGMDRFVAEYAALANDVPVFRLTYRPDFSALPRLAQAVRDHIVATAAAPRAHSGLAP